MPLTSSETKKAVEFLRELSISIYKMSNDNRFLTESLNQSSPEARQSLQLQYQHYSDKVNGLRNSIATTLAQHDLPFEVLDDMIAQAMKANPGAYKTIYNNWYSILYPFLLEDKNGEMDSSINNLVEFLEERLNKGNALKIKIVDFRGSRNNGSSRSWIAFYNASHSKQSTAKQLFINIENGICSYCLYDRPNEQKIDEKSFGLNEKVALETIADHFLQYLPEILADNPSTSNVEIIRLHPNENIFKVSMGQDEFSDEEYKFLIERATLVMHKGTNPMGRTNTSQGDFFSDRMKVGDYVYVCHGNKEVTALGRVTSDVTPCDYNNWGEDGWIQRKIDVLKNSIRQEPYSGPQKWWTPNYRSTCYPISPEEVNLGNQYLFRPLFNVTFEISEYKNMTNELKDSLLSNNIILYGPPGTGKTYSTAMYAVSVIERRPLEEVMQEGIKDRKALLGRFEYYKRNGQIEFITFHQNYSYEEFIQGIRPQVESATQLLFEKKDGLFKRFADAALKNLEASAGDLNSYGAGFDDIFDAFFKPLIDETGTVRISMDTPGYSFELTKYNPEQKNFSFVKQSGGTGHTLYIPTLRLYFEQPDVDHTQGLRSYYKPLAKKMREKATEMEKIMDSIEAKNYVLIIDEINRANISRVFGELITLIEEDKRWGNREGMKINLPSGDEFTVPNNLYIIGTMNTADRSIALLDVALRRRFDFEALYPIYDEKEWWGPMLRSLNEAIFEKKKNPDFFIGHAFFINKQVNDKVTILNGKVVPLLNEYFQDNGVTAMYILQKAGINCRKGTIMENFQIIIEDETFRMG